MQLTLDSIDTRYSLANNNENNKIIISLDNIDKTLSNSQLV